MKLVRSKLDPKNPPEIDEEFKWHIDAMTPEHIEQNALDDSDSPPMTEAELQQVLLARRIRQLLKRLNMTKGEFAATYRFSLDQLSNLEKGITEVEEPVIAYIDVIAANPPDVAGIVATARKARSEQNLAAPSAAGKHVPFAE